MDQTLFIVGINHRTAAVAVRERLAYADDEIVAALGRLSGAAPAVAEAALLSTCNRVEVVGVAADPARAAEETLKFLAADRGVEQSVFNDAVYSFAGRDAARHLFRVGASLDSMVVGEPQILGQLKLAYAQASAARTVGMVLHRAFHKAFTVAKRVRRGTLIGHGSVSVSSAAVSLAGQIFDTLKDKTVMLMGAGKMAELTARQLTALGIESLLITSRTFDRAVALARELGGTAVPYENYKPYLKMVDVLIGSVSSTRPVIGPEEFEAVVRERRYRPLRSADRPGHPRRRRGPASRDHQRCHPRHNRLPAPHQVRRPRHRGPGAGHPAAAALRAFASCLSRPQRARHPRYLRAPLIERVRVAPVGCFGVE